MNAKHIPGPWSVWESDDNLLSVGPGHVGTQICNFFDENGEAYPCAESNARLISAAPDHAMLAAVLASGKARWEPLPGSGNSGEVCFGGIRYHTRLDEFGVPAMTNALRAAIAKAEGGAA